MEEKYEYKDLQLAISILRAHFADTDNYDAQFNIDRLDDQIKGEMANDSELHVNDVKARITLNVDEFIIIDCALRMWANKSTGLRDYEETLKLLNKLTQEFYDLHNWVD